jgi:hypothetical protein
MQQGTISALLKAVSEIKKEEKEQEKVEDLFLPMRTLEQELSVIKSSSEVEQMQLLE